MHYLKNNPYSLKHIIAIPVISSVIIPIVIADIWIELYHRICFPLYGLPLVSRSDYIKIDRHKLSYLDFWQKIYCAYCGYANGLINYFQEIAGKTEQYWCGIRHKKSPGFVEQEHHKKFEFVDYGDKEEFEKKYG